MRKEKLLFMVPFATFLLLACSLETAYATVANETENSAETVLPDFLLRMSEYMSKGNASELARIRNQMINQLILKQERIKETNGAVLHSSISTHNQLDDASFGFLNTIEGYSPIMYDESNYIIGRIDDWDYLKYNADGYCAFLKTNGWSENTSNIYGGEACANGYMSNEVAWGDYYIVANEGPTGDYPFLWANYVILWGSWYYGEFEFIGYEQVLCSELTEIYIGSSASQFNCLAVACWTPPWYPQNYYPHIYNSVFIDAIYGTSYW